MIRYAGTLRALLEDPKFSGWARRKSKSLRKEIAEACAMIRQVDIQIAKLEKSTPGVARQGSSFLHKSQIYASNQTQINLAHLCCYALPVIFCNTFRGVRESCHLRLVLWQGGAVPLSTSLIAMARVSCAFVYTSHDSLFIRPGHFH